MANKPLRSIKFPDLPDTYTIPVVDSTLAVSGAAADAKKTGDEIAKKVNAVSGKGLSTEDYSSEEKEKLAGIEAEANKTIIDNTLTQIGQAADAKAVGDAIANEGKKALTAFATDTASGSIASFPDGADNIPMKDVLVHIEPVQEGSGDPSPDNVRPITGWTGAKVTRTGKNLLPVTVDGIKAMNTNVTWNGNSCIYNGVTITIQTDNSNNVIGLNFNGTANPYFYFNVTPDFAIDGSFIISPLPQGASYNNAFYGRILYEDGTDTGFLSNERSFTKQNVNGRIQIVVATGSTVNFTYRPMLRFASDTDSSYEPYHADTYDITFPTEAGTVYGGTLNVTKGELVVDRICHTYEGGMDNIITSRSIDSSTKGLSIRTAAAYNHAAGGNAQDSLNLIKPLCDKLKTTWFLDVISATNCYAPQGNWPPAHIIKVDGLTTTDEYDAWCAENKPQMSWLLATPITYTLTPQEITSLLGANNLWADTGDSEVEYRADTKLYITKKITEAVSALS